MSDSEKVLARVALARAAGSASRGETEQLQRVLADQRRENQVLTEEIHQLNTKLASTAAARDRDSLQADKNGMAGAVQALQLQLAQLQTADTALKARQQQDQAVRSLSECEADLAVGRARQAELERDRLAAQLSREQELHRQQVMSVCFVPFSTLHYMRLTGPGRAAGQGLAAASRARAAEEGEGARGRAAGQPCRATNIWLVRQR